jgi:hypothetical protein
MKKNVRTVVILLAVFATIFLIVSGLGLGQNEKNPVYTEIVEYFKQDKVESAVVDALTGELKIVLKEDGKEINLRFSISDYTSTYGDRGYSVCLYTTWAKSSTEIYEIYYYPGVTTYQGNYWVNDSRVGYAMGVIDGETFTLDSSLPVDNVNGESEMVEVFSQLFVETITELDDYLKDTEFTLADFGFKAIVIG